VRSLQMKRSHEVVSSARRHRGQQGDGNDSQADPSSPPHLPLYRPGVVPLEPC
jgi:hypothetical protein